MKKFLVCICIFAAMLAAISLSACKKNAVSITDSGGSTEKSAEIPFVGDFACEYYGGDGFNSPVERIATFDSEDELLIKISFTLFTDAYNAGKRKLTLKPVLSEGFIGNIVAANTSEVDNEDLTVAYDADDKISKNCSIEIKVKFNYCSGNLKIGYAYDYDEFQTTGAYNLLCDRTLNFTYDKTIYGYTIYNKNYLYADSWVKGLTEIDIPAEYNGEPVKRIGENTFNNCRSLTRVRIPDTVSSIGAGAFYNCPIVTAELPAWLISDIPKSKLKSVEITSGKTIEKEAFKNCTALSSVTISDSVESVGSRAFYNCSIEEATIPTTAILSVSTAKLKKVNITSGQSIFPSAFISCKSLTSVTIPDSITSIGISAFSECDNLQYNEYGNACYLGNEKNPYFALIKAENSAVTSVDINGSTKIIGGGAFARCENLTTVIMPDSVTSVGNRAFYGCTGITSIELSNELTTIGEEGFSVCNSLPSITIPRSITSIGRSAFAFCHSLSVVTISVSSIFTKIDTNAFGNCGNLTSVIFSGSKETWNKISSSAGFATEQGSVTVKCWDGEIKFRFI